MVLLSGLLIIVAIQPFNQGLYLADTLELFFINASNQE
jgi:hypothetical protein